MAVPSLFNAEWYLRTYPDVFEAVGNDPAAAWAHFTMHGNAEGRAPGPLFNPLQYLEQNPDVRAAVENNEITAYDHFINHGASENRSPLQSFDPEYYLQRNQDVRLAVEVGAFTAVEHFLQSGQFEPRQISLGVDLAAYLDANPDVKDAAEAGMSPLDHLLGNGLHEGRPLGNGLNVTDFQSDDKFQAALEAGDPGAALARIDEVAPFMPDFVAPEGWTPPADLPIPTDFVPADGSKLVIPDGVEVPEDTDLSNFEPVEPPVEVAPAVYADLDGVATVEGDFLWVGTANPANDFFVSTVEDAGIQVGLDFRYRGDSAEVDPETGTNVFIVDPDRVEDARFAYTVSQEDAEGAAVKLDLANYSYQLKIDTDGTEGTEFIVFNLVEQDTEGAKADAGNPSPYEWVQQVTDGEPLTIYDDGGAAHVTQNIQALQWYQENGALPEAGEQYTVQLDAFDASNNLVASSSIIIEIGAQETAPVTDGLVL